MAIASLIVAVIALFISTASVIYAKSQTETAKKSLVAPVIGELIDMYHTVEMANGTSNLLRWWQKHDKGFAKKFAEEKQNHLEKGNSLESAFPLYFDWRRAKDYFWKCWRYRQAGILSDVDVQNLMTSNQAAFYLLIIEPMGTAADNEFYLEPGQMLLRIFPDAENENLITNTGLAPL